MKKILIIVISFLALVISCERMNKDTVVKIDGINYTAEHFFRTIPGVDFENIPMNKKKELVNEYVLKKLAQLDLTENGMLDSGNLKIEMDVWKFWRLVNFSYEKIIADKILNEKNKKILYNRLSRELKVRQLLISFNSAQHPLNGRSEKDAKMLVKKIQTQINPNSFAALCKKYSDDKYTKNRGGELVGWVKAGRMLGSVDSTLFSIKTNTVSNPITSPYGYHFLVVDSSKTIPIKSFEEEQVRIKQLAYKLWETKFNNRANSLIDSLQKANPIVFFDDSLIAFYNSYSKLSTNVFHEKIYTTFDIMSVFSDSLIIGKIGDDDVNKQWIVFFLKTLNIKRPPRFNSIEEVKSLVTDNQIPYLIKKLADKLHLEKDGQYKAALDAQSANMSYDYYNKHMILENINPTTKEQKIFYENFKDSLYKTEEMVIVKEVLVSKKKLANDLFNRIKSGENIEKLAEEYSERNIGKYNNGQLPPIRRGQYGQMGKAAFSMKPNEIEGPFQLGKYYSIIKLVKKLPSTIKPYDEIGVKIKYDYIRMYQKQIQAQTYKKLKSKHNIKINKGFYNEKND